MSEELDEQLPDQVSSFVVESALKTSSKRKRRANKKKNQSNKGTTPDNVSGLTESGEVEEVPSATSSKYTSNNSSRGRFNVGVRGTNQSRGRDRRPFVRRTGESDPHDMFIAPMNISESYG